MAKKSKSDSTEPKKSKKKLIIIVLVVLLAGGAGYTFMGGKSGKAAAPVPGAVVKLDSININLAGGHYLKLGLAIQATASAGDPGPEGSQLLDSAISLFTNMTMTQLSDNTFRDKAKAELTADAEKQYPDKAMGVYFTEFVMQ